MKDRQFSPELVRAIRKMKPTRQVECAELMIAANNVTVSYAEALLVATPAARLVDGKKPPKLTGVSPEQMAKMEREMSSLQAQYKLVEQTYGQGVLNLVLAKGYLAKMLGSASAQQYLRQRQPDLMVEFEAIVETISAFQFAGRSGTENPDARAMARISSGQVRGRNCPRHASFSGFPLSFLHTTASPAPPNRS
ncbi:hypothetical protein P3T16_000293 [Paraburkholderia sp. GAS42]